MQRLLAFIERDLRKFVRNPIVVGVSILMPIIYLVILGNSFQGELKNLPLVVVDRDNGPSARRVMELLRVVESGARTVTITVMADEGAAMTALREGECKAVLVIPSGFSRSVERNTVVELGIFLDNAETISAATLQAAVTRAVTQLKSGRVAVREERGRVLLRDVEIYRKIDYDQTLIPGVVIMAIFLGAMMTGAFNIVMDKFLGVDESYLLTPLTKMDMVVGLVVSGLLITTTLAVIVLVLGSLISGIYLWRMLTVPSAFYVLAVITLSTLGLQGLMFVIMGRINHPRIVGVLGGFLNVIFFFPSGAIYPVESFPSWLKAFALVNPESYSVHALRALFFKGAGLEAVKGDIVFLAGFAVCTIVAGIFAFKRTL
ncbi:MAG: ABC transporter permease [Deltaproteobacteria bacterium]|nr:ABC transporter permease [Deltaproteobacteria bacterium]